MTEKEKVAVELVKVAKDITAAEELVAAKSRKAGLKNLGWNNSTWSDGESARNSDAWLMLEPRQGHLVLVMKGDSGQKQYEVGTVDEPGLKVINSLLKRHSVTKSKDDDGHPHGKDWISDGKTLELKDIIKREANKAKVIKDKMRKRIIKRLENLDINRLESLMQNLGA